MNNIKLKPCPLCGGSVSIALMGNQLKWFSITRGTGEDKCTCRLFMQSDLLPMDPTTEDEERIKKQLADSWNTRKPMERILEQLEEEINCAKSLWDDSEYYTGGAHAFEIAKEIVEIEKGGVDNAE